MPFSFFVISKFGAVVVVTVDNGGDGVVATVAASGFGCVRFV